ncbi:PAS domain S-box protein [Aquabacterium sp.]|uniref:hybrid sensor histidine kinase/response regulator n=1 Tax=Aquabacterium sp. TaxID=1872578 RepID=UPI002B65824A|nr:PAS domain S-box protein [Aquabacterium sp.]HSW05828.1 PAS domain S-box protein [Aquabacterium sp.]
MTEDTNALIWTTECWGEAESLLPELDPALMKLLLERISTRVAVVDLDWKYTYANHETLRFMGLPPERVIGRPMAQVLDAGVFHTLEPLFKRVFAGETLHRRGWADYQQQGRRYRDQWFLPYRPGGGPVTAVVICGLDQTEQRLREQELAQQAAQLRASEALKAAIFDNALAALVSTDATGCIVEFNPSAEAMFGHRRAQVLGLPVAEVMVPARHREAHEQGLRRWQRADAAPLPPRRLEMHALRADGSEFPMEMVLWRTTTDQQVFYTASITDVSERHGAAQQIERQREALRQSEKLSAMGNLLAGVSHELNNPLAIVMGRAALLEEKCASDPALQRDAQLIREAAERCGRIVHTFLNMARSRPARRSLVDLNPVARATAELLAYAYRSHGIDLQLQLSEPLPPVHADADQIAQVVLNLLVNAQQALSLTEGQRTVRLSTGAGTASVWLRVADNGPGIAAAARARLFEAFFTTKAEGMGTGMGLSVSRALVREHGGELQLDDSTTGAGAVFCMSLPIAPQREAQAPAVATPASVAAAPAPALARVLVVDDEEEVASLMREMLERAGYEVASAESGAVALQLLVEARFDAVVSDLHMPDMDGTALWRAICNEHPRLGSKLLFVTGDTLSPHAQAFFKASGCAGLDKPFTKAELLSKVQAVLGSRADANN